MRYLYIDTTSSFLYSAIIENKTIISKVIKKLDKDLSKEAMYLISNMFYENSIDNSSIDKIIVVNGPGSFTGIRIGVTIAKVYAWALNKKISTINSLEAMALSTNSNSDYIIPYINARRGYIYSAIYDKKMNIILKEQYVKKEVLMTVLDNLPGSYSFISNDEYIFSEKEEYTPNFLNIVEYVDLKNVIINPHSVNPLYLKKTEAEEEKRLDFND